MPTIKEQLDALDEERLKLRNKMFDKGIKMNEDAKWNELILHMYDDPVDLRTYTVSESNPDK